MKIFNKRIAGFSTKERDHLSPLSPDVIKEDVTVQQQQWLNTEEAQRQLHYWKKQLAGTSPVLQLPTDRLRPAVQSFRAAFHSFRLSRELSEDLKALSQQKGVTLFMTLLAAVNTLLFRYTRQDDIIVGTPVAISKRTELKELISPAANTVVLRTDLSGDPRFVDTLEQLRSVVTEAHTHQEYPFERLVEELQPQRDASYHPLFQVMVTMQETPGGEKLSDLTPTSTQSAPFDLTFAFSETPEGLVARLLYSADLFEAAAIARLAGHLETLLAGIIAQPEQRIGALPLLTETERHQLLIEWNDTHRNYPSTSCMHQIFEAQVRQTPEAIAVIDEQCQLTYRELNEQANRLARYLRAIGVGSEVLVGINFNRSVQMLVGLLAIFKAAGAYVPFDPDYPAERLAYMIEHAQIKVLLTLDHLRANLPIPEDVKVICIDRDREQFEQQGSENLDVPVDPDQLAYVLYTSGSTGKPKGAMIEHRGMLNHLYAKVFDLQLVDTDIAAQTASQCFDISIWQFLAVLLVGGRVHIFSDEITHDPLLLLEQTARNKITIWETVPSLLRVALERLADGGTTAFDLSSLRWLLVTGEALPPDLCQQWLACYPDIPLLNAYGPTECSDDVTHYAIHTPPSADTIHTPIGRPIINTQLYILDAQLQPVPVGITGELYVGGTGVGRGYYHDEKQTAGVFIPDPFTSEAGARMYKTGDVARYLPDGNIEFLGRVDHQVKIRGFRIELGEIEAVLRQHPMVQECLVVAQEDVRGDKRLVAYVVAENEALPSINELRRSLKEQLPIYMLPSAFVLLDTFPLTPNGKIDRKALPLPDFTDVVRDGAIAAPTTPTEIRLVEIVAPLLGLEQVGIDDNFFLIGGNSLMGMQLLAQLSVVFGIDFPTRTLLDAPTVRQLAAEIERLILVKLEAMSEDEVQLILEERYSVS
jgi:amino acid adenylation domain-containing protein